MCTQVSQKETVPAKDVTIKLEGKRKILLIDSRHVYKVGKFESPSFFSFQFFLFGWFRRIPSYFIKCIHVCRFFFSSFSEEIVRSIQYFPAENNEKSAVKAINESLSSTMETEASESSFSAVLTRSFLFQNFNFEWMQTFNGGKGATIEAVSTRIIN